jgi:hypothetical protein
MDLRLGQMLRHAARRFIEQELGTPSQVADR